MLGKIYIFNFLGIISFFIRIYIYKNKLYGIEIEIDKIKFFIEIIK